MKVRLARSIRRTLIVISAVLALTVGTASAAQADSWTTIYSYGTQNGPVSIAACKQPVDSIYGPMWRVKVLYDRQSTGYPTATISIWRNNQQVQHDSSTSWWIGRLTIIETYASAWYDDSLSAYINVGDSWSAGYGPSYVSMSRIGYC